MKRFALTLVGLVVLVITGCSQTKVGPQGIEVTLGTFNYGGSQPGIAALIVGNIPATGPDGVEVKVTGPSGWNNGDPLTSRMYERYTEPGWYWWYWRVGSFVDGDYTFESLLPDGTNLKKTVHITGSNILAQAVPSLNANTNSATISWQAVPEAISYEVDLIHKTSGGAEVVHWWRTNDTSITFNQLNLVTGDVYYAEVWAFNAPLTKLTFEPPAFFKSSYSRTSEFTVSSTGAIQLLPTAPARVPENFSGTSMN